MSDDKRTIKIDDSFKFDVDSGCYETATGWAKVRIRQDERREDYYIDVLSGSKGKDAHIHYGINADQSLRFMETRDCLNTFAVKAEDSNLGVIHDGITRFKPEDGKHKFTFKVEINEPTRTIRVLFAEASLEST